MNIRNKKTGNIVRDVRCAQSFFSKVTGLMLSTQRPLLMIFSKPEKISLHTWLVFFSLRIYYLDATGVVIENTLMHPFSFYRPKEFATYVLEVPASYDFRADCGDYLLLSTNNSR